MSKRCKAKTKTGASCQNASLDSTGYCRTHHPQIHLRPPTGAIFERDTLKVLRLLGYRVERNITVNGCQIDLFAEYRTGIIPIKLMVECKDYRNGRIVGIEEVKKFSGVFYAARGTAVDKALLVTTHGFTREAKEFAQTVGIELVTFSQISTQLVNLDDYIDKVIAEFEQSAAFPYYVELSGTEVEDYEGGDESIFHRPLDALVNRCLFEAEGNRLALLGNFGTGKTTFCREFAWQMAQQHRRDPTRRIPIVVSLSDYESKLDIQELVTNTLQFRYGVRVDLTLCQELQRLGKFLLLFDGFDEMASRVDADVIHDNLREIDKISQIPENKFILTCRTHFFRDRVQADVLGDFDIVYIPEWGEPELTEYLQKYFGNEWEQQLDRIHGTHNLTELAHTPLFLEMIVETLPELGRQVRRGELYQAYTDKWVQEESRRRGARLNSTDRRQFVHELAMKLYDEGKFLCHYSEFAPIVRDRFQVNDAAQMDYLQSDIRTCTFLTRDTNGNYGFRHKSFMEFFVAQILAREIRAGTAEHLRTKELPPEITRFLVEALSHDPPVETLTTWLQSRPEAALRENMLSLITRLKIGLLPFPSMGDVDEERESKLAAQFLQGDSQAFNALFVEYRRALIGIAYSRLKDLSLAEDVAAETFIFAWQNRERLEHVTGLKAYLRRVALNLSYDRLRKRKRLGEEQSLPLSDREIDKLPMVQQVPSTESSFEEAEKVAAEHQIMEKALQRLTDTERSLIRLRYFQERSIEDVAKEIGSTVEEVRRNTYRAKAKLTRHLKREATSYDRAIRIRDAGSPRSQG